MATNQINKIEDNFERIIVNVKDKKKLSELKIIKVKNKDNLARIMMKQNNLCSKVKQRKYQENQEMWKKSLKQ